MFSLLATAFDDLGQWIEVNEAIVTLMDLRMPQMGGVEATTALCTEFNTARIIVLTTYDSDENIYRGLRAGAKGLSAQRL